MSDGLGVCTDALLPHSKQEELAEDKVKNRCFPGTRRFISGNPTAQLTHRLVEGSRKCQKNNVIAFSISAINVTSPNVEV